ncbi:MAG TPA: hypothetical protein VG826_25000 [Pirellulales bacterium]|nr:hypothetical protein [Pirellulales bacterium]
MKNRKWARASLCQVLCGATMFSAAIGCGPSAPKIPTTYPVHGTVTLNGEPVTGGYVRFEPVEAGKGMEADGAVQSDGSYKVRAFAGQPGTTPGDYKVFLSSVSRMREGEDYPEQLPIPAKYQNKDTSGIIKTVTSDDNQIDLELTGEVEEPETTESDDE